MKTKLMTMALITVLTLTVFGCATEPPQEPIERQDQALLYWKPFWFKWAIELIGHGLNGISLNDETQHLVVAVSLDAVTLKKGKVLDLHLKRTRFYEPKKKSGALEEVKHKKLEEARFTGYLEDGTEIALRIEGSKKVKDLPETYRVYEVVYQSGETWEPLCGTDEETGEPIQAVALGGTWEYEVGVDDGGAWIPNPRLFTFACEGFVLAKCVELGYMPWADGQICDTEDPEDSCIEATLASRHQACTRALRADYCGDGSSHTVDGVLVNLYDGIGIRGDAEDWLLEAEWDADGARCVVAARVAALPTPPCIATLELPECGNPVHFEEGALLFTEVDIEDVP